MLAGVFAVNGSFSSALIFVVFPWLALSAKKKRTKSEITNEKKKKKVDIRFKCVVEGRNTTRETKCFRFGPVLGMFRDPHSWPVGKCKRCSPRGGNRDVFFFCGVPTLAVRCVGIGSDFSTIRSWDYCSSSRHEPTSVSWWLVADIELRHFPG